MLAREETVLLLHTLIHFLCWFLYRCIRDDNLSVQSCLFKQSIYLTYKFLVINMLWWFYHMVCILRMPKLVSFVLLFPVYGANETMSSSLFLLMTPTGTNKYIVFDWRWFLLTKKKKKKKFFLMKVFFFKKKKKKKELQEFLFCYHDEFFSGCWDVPDFFLVEAEECCYIWW